MEDKENKLEKKERSSIHENEVHTDPLTGETNGDQERSEKSVPIKNEENEHQAREDSERNQNALDGEKQKGEAERSKGLTIFTEKGQKQLEKLQKEGPFDLNAYAGFWIRFCAYLVDLLIIASLRLMIVRPIVLLLDLDSEGVFSVKNIMSVIIFYAYFIFLTKYTGQTLGKMIFGIRVIPLHGNRLTWDTVIFRELVGRYICHTVKILYVLAGLLPKKQGLHDYFADTCVIHEEVVNKQSVEKLLQQH